MIWNNRLEKKKQILSTGGMPFTMWDIVNYMIHFCVYVALFDSPKMGNLMIPVLLTQPMDPEKKSLNFIFPTKYVIPKSLKFSHWLSKFREGDITLPAQRLTTSWRWTLQPRRPWNGPKWWTSLFVSHS